VIKVYDVIIIGGAGAGLTAAIYSARRAMKTLVITKDIGGQASLASTIENYPGHLEISGIELMQRFQEQAKKSGAEIVFDEVSEIKALNGNYLVKTSSKEYETKTVILAFGKTPRSLGVPGEKEFQGRGVSYCAVCLPPNSLIISNPSVEEIEKLTEGKYVLTHDGSYREVLAVTSKDYDGKVVKIKPRFFREEVSLTPEHPVLVTTLKKGKGKNYFNFQFSNPFWVKAGDINKNHIVLYPINKKVKDIDYINISEILDFPTFQDFVKNEKETYTSKKVPSKIPVDGRFLRLAGYYLADGHIEKNGIAFNFSIEDEEYVYDAMKTINKLFKLKPRVKKIRNIIRLNVYSLIIQKLFEKLFGKYSYNKSVPFFMMFLPPHKEEEIIKGIWVGDGSRGPKSFDIVTNSAKLAHQIKNILLRLGIIPSVSFRNIDMLNKKPSKIGKRVVYFKHGKYNIGVGGIFLKKMGKILGVEHPKIKEANKNCEYAWIINNYAYLPIRRVTTDHYKGKVFNLVIKNNNTYTTTGFIVHNCDLPLFKDKIVAVVGGGNSALDAALYGSEIAKKVYLIHRRKEFRGFEYLVDRAKQRKNVELVLDSMVKEVKGENFVKSVVIQNVLTNEIREIMVDGVFIEVGFEVKVDFIRDLVNLDESNQIIVNNSCETFYPKSRKKRPGIFAAGDVTNLPFKQIVISAGDGAKAALQAYTYVTKTKAPLIADWIHGEHGTK